MKNKVNKKLDYLANQKKKKKTPKYAMACYIQYNNIRNTEVARQDVGLF